MRVNTTLKQKATYSLNREQNEACDQKLDTVTTFPPDEIVSKRSIVYFDGGRHT